MNDESTVIETFRDYTEAFRKLDPKALLPFYHYPALVIDKDKGPKILIHPIIGFIGFSNVLRDLRKQGYGYSKLHELSAKQLSKNVVIVSGTATRCRKDDTKIEDIGFTYTLQKTLKGWKIVVGIIHNTETFLTLPKS